MTSRRALLLLSLTGSLLAACGGHDEGGGTKTLYVRAQAETDGSTKGSYIVVEVRQGSSEGQIVNDAVVTLRGDNTGEVGLPFQGGDWFGFRFGGYGKAELPWDTGWGLKVTRGADELEAYLEAPGITTITSPISWTTFRRANGDDLQVTWKDEKNRRADYVTIDFARANGADREMTGDERRYVVDFNRLEADDKERIEVKRRNEVNLAGGTPGSRFSATTKHRIELKVE